jgi:hypothetical protein
MTPSSRKSDGLALFQIPASTLAPVPRLNILRRSAGLSYIYLFVARTRFILFLRDDMPNRYQNMPGATSQVSS